jgi:hypothetical protein
MIEAAKAHAPNCCFNVRVTHASGMLEGHYTADTEFPENDHRRHRPRSWVTNGVRKNETIEFRGRDLTAAEMQRIEELNARNFGVTEEPMVYKGTMERRASSVA